MTITLQQVIEQSLGVFFYNISSEMVTYISTVVTLAIIGGLFSLFLSIFTHRKNSAKIVIFILIIAISVCFILSHYFDLALDFENTLASIKGGA